MLVYGPDSYNTCTSDTKAGQKGQYELPLVSTDRNFAYRVRLEAEGYRSVVSARVVQIVRRTREAGHDIAARPGTPRPSCGRSGPARRTSSCTGSPTENPSIVNGVPDGYDSRPIHTDGATFS